MPFLTVKFRRYLDTFQARTQLDWDTLDFFSSLSKLHFRGIDHSMATS